MNKESIQSFFDNLGQPAANAIQQYTGWVLVSSITGMLIGIALLVGVKFIPSDWRDEVMNFGVILKVFMVIFGVLLIASSLPDLLQPEAGAIHRLINDIRG